VARPTDVFEPVSARNPIVPQLRRLSRRRSARLEQGRFLVEGPTLVAAAIAAGASVQIVLKDGAVALDGDQQHLVERAVAAGARALELPAGVLAKVAHTVTPQPLAAVVTRRTTSLDELVGDLLGDRHGDPSGRPGIDPGSDVSTGGPASSPLPAPPPPPPWPVLVLVDVADPGNAGTLLRSAEAAGATAVVFCAGSVDPFNPKTVRSSAGSLFHVPVVDGVEARAVLAALGAAGVHRVGTVARGGVALAEARLEPPVALVLGSEAHGLPDGLDALLDERVTIPMAGRAESLNVAMAGTLVAFEAARRRPSPT
jgi:TrmH family RNA methyltransferase